MRGRKIYNFSTQFAQQTQSTARFDSVVNICDDLQSGLAILLITPPTSPRSVNL